jgi:hypothetical protein
MTRWSKKAVLALAAGSLIVGGVQALTGGAASADVLDEACPDSSSIPLIQRLPTDQIHQIENYRPWVVSGGQVTLEFNDGGQVVLDCFYAGDVIHRNGGAVFDTGENCIVIHRVGSQGVGPVGTRVRQVLRNGAFVPSCGFVEDADLL